MARPKKNKIILTDQDVADIKKLLKKKDINQTQTNRCRILLALDENHTPVMTYNQCVSFLGVSKATIANTAKLYCEGGIEKMMKINRNVNSDNAHRKVDGRTEAKIIEVACGPVPEGHCRWTIRLLEEHMKIVLDEPISREAIRRTLKKTGLNLTVTTTGAYQA